MNYGDAIEYVKEVLEGYKGLMPELADLVLWAYNKGWTDGVDDYRENKNRTEEQEFYKSR